MRGAWEAMPERGNLSGGSFPYYHRWFFRTGIEGDFEYLVRLLKPRPMDARVGRRDIDVQRPGSNLDGIARSRQQRRAAARRRVANPHHRAVAGGRKCEADRFEKWDESAAARLPARPRELHQSVRRLCGA